MVVLTPTLYAVTVCLIALLGAGTAATFIRYRERREAIGLLRLVAFPVALVGVATMFFTNWGGRLLAVYAVVTIVGDVILSRRQTRRGLLK